MEFTFPGGFVMIALETEPFALNAFQIGEHVSFSRRMG